MDQNFQAIDKEDLTPPTGKLESIKDILQDTLSGMIFAIFDVADNPSILNKLQVTPLRWISSLSMSMLNEPEKITGFVPDYNNRIQLNLQLFFLIK